MAECGSRCGVGGGTLIRRGSRAWKCCMQFCGSKIHDISVHFAGLPIVGAAPAVRGRAKVDETREDAEAAPLPRPIGVATEELGAAAAPLPRAVSVAAPLPVESAATGWRRGRGVTETSWLGLEAVRERTPATTCGGSRKGHLEPGESLMTFLNTYGTPGAAGRASNGQRRLAAYS